MLKKENLSSFCIVFELIGQITSLCAQKGDSGNKFCKSDIF